MEGIIQPTSVEVLYRGEKPGRRFKEEAGILFQKTALQAYRALRVRDYGRVDLRLTDTCEVYVIEVNSSCYLEKDSEFAMAAKADGLEYNDLIQRIVDEASARWAKLLEGPRRKRAKAST